MSNGRYQPYPRYKPTGAAWLESVPESWDVFDGKRIFESCRETAHSTDEQLAASQKFGVVPQSLMMELNDAKVMLALKGTSTFRHVEKHDFVISLRSFEGGIEYSAYTGCVSPAYTVLRPTKPVVSAYYKHLFKSRPYISALQATTDSLRDGKAINYEQFGAIPLILPPLPEQTQIAKFLDHETAKIDRLIEKQEALIRLLREKRQAVISHAVTKGLNPHAPLKDSGIPWLGQVPAHWATPPFYVRYEQVLGKMLDQAKMTGRHPTPYLRNIDVRWDHFNTDELPTMDIRPVEKERFTVRRGDILMVEGRELGRCAIWAGEDDVIGFQKALHRLRPRNDSEVNRFFYYTMVCAHAVGAFMADQQPNEIPHLTGEELRQHRFPKPPVAEQAAIVRYLDAQTAKFEALSANAQHGVTLLQERRTALISAAVTGKIDVRHWQPPSEQNN